MTSDPLGDYLPYLAPSPQKVQPEPEEQEQPWTPGRHFADESDGLSGKPLMQGGERVSPQTFDLDIVAVRHCRFPCELDWHRH